MKLLTVDFNGKPVSGWAERVGNTLWVHVNGRTIAYEPPKKAARGKSRGASGQDAGHIKAPMPGKINKLAVNVGDKVAAHQVLVVMEAMKMEYTLKAPAGGRVAAVDCAVGDQVALGQVLVLVEPESETGA